MPMLDVPALIPNDSYTHDIALVSTTGHANPHCWPQILNSRAFSFSCRSYFFPLPGPSPLHNRHHHHHVIICCRKRFCCVPKKYRFCSKAQEQSLLQLACNCDCCSAVGRGGDSHLAVCSDWSGCECRRPWNQQSGSDTESRFDTDVDFSVQPVHYDR